MYINKENDKLALNLIKINLPSKVLEDKNVADLLIRIGVEVNPHYCVNYMNYSEDGIYDFPEGTKTFATKQEAVNYIIEQEMDFYYDDETREAVTINPDGTEKRSTENYFEVDAGPYRIWKEE